jgi:hypothetical protein
VKKNKKYALFGYSEKLRQYEDTNFDKILLIDSEEKTFYVVDPKIDINDTFLRLDMTGFNVFSYNSKSYFTAKTGAIFTYEKQSVFDQQKSEIIYKLTNFTTATCIIKKYDILKDSYEMLKKERLYNQVLTFNNNIYGVLTTDTTILIDNIITSKEIFNYNYGIRNPRAIYIDEKVVVFTVVANGSQTDTVICNIQTGEIINIYEDRYAEFIKKADTLALYKSWGGPY